jgi:hypothetical protein
MWTLGEGSPQNLELHQEGGGYEVYMAPFATYAAIERDLG